jgi:hypothetical protein
MIKETNDYGGKAIGHMMICNACEDKYRQAGQFLSMRMMPLNGYKQEKW